MSRLPKRLFNKHFLVVAGVIVVLTICFSFLIPNLW